MSKSEASTLAREVGGNATASLALAHGPAANADAADWGRGADANVSADPLLLSLVTLSELNGRPTSAQAMLATLPLPENGRLTAPLALRAAARAGLVARVLKRDLAAIDELALPAILLLHDGNACILVGREGNSNLRILMPETGRGEVLVPLAAMAGRYAGWTLFARPELVTEREERRLEQTRSGHWFWRTVLAQWPTYAEVVMAAVLVNLFALASPLFVMNVYDRVVPHNAIETLWVLAIGVITVFGFDFLLRTLRGYFVDSAGRVADIKLAGRIFEQVLGMRMAARPRFAGAFANQLREFESLRDVFASATITTLVDLPFVALFIGIIWLLSGPVALVPALAVPIVIIVGLLMQLPLNVIVRRTLEEGARKHAILVETINGLETVKSVGAEGRMQRGWERYVAAAATSGNRSRFLSAITVNFAGLATNCVTVGVIAVGVYQIAAGNITVGALVASSILAGRAMAPLGQVAQLLARLHQARAAYRTLDGMMRLPVERPTGTRFVHRPRLRGDIELRNVSFTYPGQKIPALNEVTFKIAAGERVGIIGRIGSGKTTIEKLVLGLYEPDGGAVLVDGTDLRQIDPADLRRNIGAVPQDVILFAGSVRENITISAPHADDEAMLRAASIAGVEAFVARHPSGYDRDVGERGQALSGGQRQAVALARALLGDPPILLLDEPTAAMDNAGEAALKARLSETLAGRTLLLVTHRASLLSLVDRLIVLDGGALVADGPKDEIMRALAAGQVRGVV